MRCAIACLLAVVWWCTPVTAAAGEDKNGVKFLPPVVVKTEPVSGDTAVDPALKEIKISFSKDMKDKSWSFVRVSKETYPKTVGDPKYLDKRTVVLPVELEPGKTYILWLNNQKFGNFRDEQNYAAVPYLLVFETQATKAP